MTLLAQLPADQRAVLDLVLRRGRSYGGIAGTLRLDVDAVRARARDAVSSLGAPARAVPDARRAQITDWLLGQADAQTAEDVCAYLAASAPGRAWARSAAAQLGTIAGDRLPSLPAPAARRAPRKPLPPAAHLVAIAVPALLVIVIGIVVGSSDDPPAPAGAQAAPALPEAVLASARPGSDAQGTAEIQRRGSAHAIAVVASGLPRSTRTAAYTVWLTRGGRDGATHVATLRTDARGRIDGLSPLDVDASRFREVLVSRQRNTATPTRPGMVVLRGPLR